MMRELYVHDGCEFNEARSRCGTLELLNSPDQGCIWLIEADGKPAGYCVLTYGFSIEYYGRHGFIDELFVDWQYRSRGLGRAAIEHASAFCHERGMRMILLEVT